MRGIIRIQTNKRHTQKFKTFIKNCFLRCEDDLSFKGQLCGPFMLVEAGTTITLLYLVVWNGSISSGLDSEGENWIEKIFRVEG